MENMLNFILDELYPKVCASCRYLKKCQNELYDCPAIIKLAKIISILKAEGE